MARGRKDITDKNSQFQLSSENEQQNLQIQKNRSYLHTSQIIQPEQLSQSGDITDQQERQQQFSYPNSPQEDDTPQLKLQELDQVPNQKRITHLNGKYNKSKFKAIGQKHLHREHPSPLSQVVGTQFMSFKQPTQQELCKGIQALKKALPFSSIQRVIYALYKLIIPKQSPALQFPVSGQILTSVQKYKKYNQNKQKQPQHKNIQSDQILQLKLSQSEDLNFRAISQISRKKYNKTIQKEEKEKINVFNKQIGACSVGGSLGAWLNKYQTLPDDDPYFKSQRKIAKVFLKFGPSAEAANKFLKNQLKDKKSHNCFRNIARAAFRKVQSYMREIAQMNIEILSKQNFSHLGTPLIHCREWMDTRSLQVFFAFVKIMFRIKIRDDDMPDSIKVIDFHELLMKTLEERLMYSYEKKGYPPKQYEKIRGHFSSKSKTPLPTIQDSPKPPKIHYWSLQQKIHPFQLNSVSYQERKQPQKDYLKLKFNDSEVKPVKQQFCTEKENYLPSIQWTEEMERQFAKLYIEHKKIKNTKNQFLNHYREIGNVLTSRQAKLKLEMLCRLGFKKLQVLAVQADSQGIHEMPLSDVVQLFLRSPEGIDLRIIFLKVLLSGQLAKQDLRLAIDRIKFLIHDKKQQIIKEMERAQNRGKNKVKENKFYQNQILDNQSWVQSDY